MKIKSITITIGVALVLTAVVSAVPMVQQKTYAGGSPGVGSNGGAGVGGTSTNTFGAAGNGGAGAGGTSSNNFATGNGGAGAGGTNSNGHFPIGFATGNGGVGAGHG
ncbi:MAG: hypothetical protein WAM14_24320, partial [Candidatus Nitrosopolaris sp.]